MSRLQNDSHHLSQPALRVCSGFSPVLTAAEEVWVGGWRGGWGFGSLTPPTLGSGKLLCCLSPSCATCCASIRSFALPLNLLPRKHTPTSQSVDMFDLCPLP